MQVQAEINKAKVANLSATTADSATKSNVSINTLYLPVENMGYHNAKSPEGSVLHPIDGFDIGHYIW